MNLHFWDKIPWGLLPSSAKVDITLLLLGIKPSLRLILQSSLAYLSLKEILTTHRVAYYQDALYVAPNLTLLSQLIQTDNHLMPHEIKLGQLLGYPLCCCQHTAEIGEQNIDVYNRAYSANCRLNSLLDISLYENGISLISHVPCHNKCLFSLHQARSFYKKLKSSQGSPQFNEWRNRLLDYYTPAFKESIDPSKEEKKESLK